MTNEISSKDDVLKEFQRTSSFDSFLLFNQKNQNFLYFLLLDKIAALKLEKAFFFIFARIDIHTCFSNLIILKINANSIKWCEIITKIITNIFEQYYFCQCHEHFFNCLIDRSNIFLNVSILLQFIINRINFYGI